MSEWIVDIQSMIPIGELGERMIVARVDRMTNAAEMMCAPMMKLKDNGCFIEDSEVFMRSHGYSTAFGTSDIDQFLQAMMNAGWNRGLRPKSFDPSAGELAAVNRHLEDMRRLANADPPKLIDPVTDDIGGVDKSW